MPHHTIRRGLDIPLAGAASGGVVDLDRPATVAFDPREFRGMIPRLAAREGDVVKAGQPLFFHKFDDRVAVVSPVAGTVKAVERGRRRVITQYVVEVGEGETITHKTWSLDALATIDRQAALEQLLAGGAWPLLRTRPFDYLANPDDSFQAAWIGAYETGPLVPGADVLLSDDDAEALQAAVHVLNAVVDGGVYVGTGPDAPKAVAGLKGAEVHSFSGPHPAGDCGVQINHVCPPSGGGKVLYLKAWDAVVLGKLFLTGQLDPTRIYAAVGGGVTAPRYVRTLVGAPVADVVGSTVDGEVRWILGSILTGPKRDAKAHAPWFSRAVTVISEEFTGHELVGWAMPNLGMYSAHAAYLTGLLGTGGKTWNLPPRLWGGVRAIVPTGVHKTVVATPDILPTFLFKSMIAGDLPGSAELGLLDITEEEAALLSFICPSKIDYDEILRDSLAQYAKEV